MIIYRGLQISKASIAACINYTHVVYAYIFDIFIYRLPVDYLGILGSVFIGVSVFLVNADKKVEGERLSVLDEEKEKIKLNEVMSKYESGAGIHKPLIEREFSGDPSNHRFSGEQSMHRSSRSSNRYLNQNQMSKNWNQRLRIKCSLQI